MTVLVTGANGLLATNTIIALLSRGYRVKGLVRDARKFMLPLHDNLELAVGDIMDTASLKRAVSGCDGIIHCAATTDQNLLHYEDYHRINVTGTDNIIEAAISHGLKKIVYVSTANTFGYGTLQQPGDENIAIREPFKSAWYAKSKLQGERRVLTAQNRIEVTVVNPTFMLGAYDGKPSSGAIIRMGYRKRLIFHPPGGKNFVNVEDAAHGVVSALEHGKNGAAYLLAGENLSYREFFGKLARQTDTRPFFITLPKPLLLTLGYIGNLARAVGIRTALSSTNMRILCVKNYYSNNKAQKELGITFRPIEAGIDDAVKWFRQHRML